MREAGLAPQTTLFLRCRFDIPAQLLAFRLPGKVPEWVASKTPALCHHHEQTQPPSGNNWVKPILRRFVTLALVKLCCVLIRRS